MTPKQRGEKIKEGLFPRAQLTPLQVNYIVTQIEEAEREAVGDAEENHHKSVAVGMDVQKGFENEEQAYASGFKAAIEKAAGIAVSMGPMKGSENDGMVYCLDVADRILKMEVQ